MLSDNLQWTKESCDRLSVLKLKEMFSLSVPQNKKFNESVHDRDQNKPVIHSLF